MRRLTASAIPVVSIPFSSDRLVMMLVTVGLAMLQRKASKLSRDLFR